MDKRIKLTIGIGLAVLLLAAVFATAAFAQGPGDAFGTMGNGRGMMGSGQGMMGNSQGMMGNGQGMMSNGQGIVGSASPISGTMPVTSQTDVTGSLME